MATHKKPDRRLATPAAGEKTEKAPKATKAPQSQRARKAMEAAAAVEAVQAVKPTKARSAKKAAAPPPAADAESRAPEAAPRAAASAVPAPPADSGAAPAAKARRKKASGGAQAEPAAAQAAPRRGRRAVQVGAAEPAATASAAETAPARKAAAKKTRARKAAAAPVGAETPQRPSIGPADEAPAGQADQAPAGLTDVPTAQAAAGIGDDRWPEPMPGAVATTPHEPAAEPTAESAAASEDTAAPESPGRAGPESVTGSPAATPAPAPAPARRGGRRRRRGTESAGHDGAPSDTEGHAEAPPEPASAAPGAKAPPESATPPGPSRLELIDGKVRRLRWQGGGGCPPRLREALAPYLDREGLIATDDADLGASERTPPFDTLLPQLQRLAADAGHGLEVDARVWPHLAALRDARTRCAWLAAVFPDAAASAALQQLLAVRLPAYQAEGALWAVAAGRALLADESGLGKGVQAIAAAEIWQRHLGLERVLVLCAAAQQSGWQRAWRQLAGRQALVFSALPHQRPAQWASEATLRLLTPEVLQSDAAHVADWAPQLVIVDEPQRLALDAAAWAALDAPHALVLCGAPLDQQPALLEQLIDWLDRQRLGPLGAWQTLRSAREQQQPPDDQDIERVTRQLSRVLLQRQRADVDEQLPPVILGARLVMLGDAQRQAHERSRAQALRLLAGWRRSGYLSDAEQWRLSECLQAMQQAAHRADPAHADSPLAEAMVQALAGQLDDWADTDPGSEEDAALPDARGVLPAPVWLLCESTADAQQLAERLGPRPGLTLVPPGPLPAGQPQRVLQVGVPWRWPSAALGRRAGRPDSPDDAPASAPAAGQHRMLVVAEGSIDIGLLDTLAQRTDTPRGPAEPGGRGFLAGDRLSAWLRALAAALGPD